MVDNSSIVYNRHYLRDVLTLIANLQANPLMHGLPQFAGTRIHYIMKSPAAEVAGLASVVAQASAVGLKIVPGFRLMEGRAGMGYFDEARWTQNTANLEALLTKMAELDLAPELIFDTEIYPLAGTSEPGAPLFETFAPVFAPFAAVLAAHSAFPAMYPVAAKDLEPWNPKVNLLATMMVEAVGGKGEFWTYDFGYSELLRTNPDAAMKRQNEMARLIGLAAQRYKGEVDVVIGDYDHLQRITGAPAWANSKAYFGKKRWTFDIVRKDNALWATPAWYNYSTVSTTNDLQHCWVLPPLSQPQTFTSVPGNKTLMKFQALTAGTTVFKDLRSPYGLMLSSGLCLRGTDVYPRATAGPANLTHCVEFVLPAGGVGPVMGTTQLNFRAWQVVVDANRRLILELTQPWPVARVQLTILDVPPVGVPMRVAVSNLGNVWRAQAATQMAGTWVVQPAVSITPPSPSTHGGGHTYLGGGTDLSSATNPSTVFDGLTIARCELWHRALTDAEMTSVLLRPYPRLA